MTGTPNAAAAADDGQGIPADLLADGQAPAAEQPNAEDEGFARRLGWRPKEEYRGPQDKWIPADAYIEKVNKEVPVLRERLRSQDGIIQNQQRQIEDISRQSREQGEALRELLDRSRGAEDRGWHYTRESIRAEMRKAAAEADLNKYAQLEQSLDALDRERPQPKPAAKADEKKPDAQGQPDPSVMAWLAANPWYNADPEMRAFAAAVENNLANTDRALSTADRLAKTREKVVKAFPENFPNEARNRASAVSTPSGQSARPPKPKGKTLADLPPEAKDMLARIKKRDASFTDEDYLKTYQWDK